MKCRICRHQQRSQDLIEVYRHCVACGDLYCVPHHSANPIEMRGVTPFVYTVNWADWGNKITQGQIPGQHLCLLCGLSPQKGLMPKSQWDEIEKQLKAREGRATELIFR